MSPEGTLSVEEIASICHAANCQLQALLGEVESVPWNYAKSWLQRSVIHGVQWRLANPEASLAAQHDQWMEGKIADGWVYGPIKNEIKKQHPCIMPFEKLPPGDRLKDRIFVAIVRALAPSTLAAVTAPAG